MFTVARTRTTLVVLFDLLLAIRKIADLSSNFTLVYFVLKLAGLEINRLAGRSLGYYWLREGIEHKVRVPSHKPVRPEGPLLTYLAQHSCLRYFNFKMHCEALMCDPD